MYEDIESNFWKEHFTHLQHKNMVNTTAERLDREGFLQAVQKFSSEHIEYNPMYEDNGSYITWEATVTNSIKIRLFYQYQIKGSLMQKQSSEFVKIADAKFPYNPFGEILEFLKKKNQYEAELEQLQKSNLQNNMKTKIAGEFIKACLLQKFKKEESTFWNLEPVAEGFILTLNRNHNETQVKLSYTDFVSVLDNISK